MTEPEFENGYTMIANEILEQLTKVHLTSNQWQVLIYIIRKTYGFHKKVDYIANFQIVEATGLCKSVVSRVLHSLNDMAIITRQGRYTGIQKDWKQWKVSRIANTEKLAESSTKLAISSTELAESSTKVSSPAVTQKKKETITKENNASTGKTEKLTAQSTPFEEELFKIIGRLEAFSQDKAHSARDSPILKLREVMADYPGLNYRLEFKKFIEYWGSGQRKLKRPWLALRNWLERAKKDGSRKTGPGKLSTEEQIERSIEEAQQWHGGQ